MAQDLHDSFRLSTVGKMFLAGMAGYVLGQQTGLKVRGTPEEVDAIKNALMASRRFREELSVPGASVETVIQKLKLKHASAREFERVLKVPWPLIGLMSILTMHATPYIV